jgi:hypothetical protein
MTKNIDKTATPPTSDDSEPAFDHDNFNRLTVFLPVPEYDDPIMNLGPDDPISARIQLKWLDTEAPSSTQKDFYTSMTLPRTLVTQEHENSWDAWAQFAHDPENLKAKWHDFFGDNVPVMTTYEMWAIVKNVHDRLLHRWSESCLPPSATDCYDPVRGAYWRKGKDGGWRRYTEKQYRRRLFRKGRFLDKGPGGAPAEIDSDIEAVTERQAIITEGMSGYKAGIHQEADRLYLARYGYEMIEPDAGVKPDKTLAWLNNLLGEDGMDRMLDWLCHAIEALLAGRRGQSRILAIAGTANCGKSFLIREIVRLMLGGRAADAAQRRHHRFRFGTWRC